MLAEKFADYFDRDDNIWLIDSDTTKHMVNSEDGFVSLQKFDVDDFVIVANDSKVSVLGIGDVRFQHNINNRFEYVTIRNALFVPGLTANLISAGQLTENNFEVKFGNKKCTVTKNGE